jgi:general secretion pathway protein D
MSSSLSYRVAVGVLLSILPRALYAEPVHAQPVSEKPLAPAIGEDETLYSCKNRTGKVTVTFKPETELKDLVAWVMGFTCKNFVLDPRIVSTGKKVTLIVPNEMSTADAYRVFLVALSTIGLTVVPKGKVLRIVESAAAKAQNVPFLKNVLPDATDQVVRYVYRPTYAQAATLQQAFTALKSDAGDVQLIDSIVLITDYGNHVRDMMSLARLIDVPGGSDGIYTIPVQHADAAKLAEKIGQLLGTPGGAPVAGKGAPAAPPRETAAAVPSKILVDERTNTLVLAASEAAYLRVKALVERLDISLDIENGAAMHVYRLGSAIAEELAKTLTDAISGNQAKTTAPRPGGPPVPIPVPASPADALGTSLEGPVRVIADAPTNSLIVMSSGRDFIAIKDIIRQLDQQRRQVYIEAVILEVAVGNGLSAGASSHGGIATSSGAIALGGVQMPNLSTLDMSSLNASGLIGGIIGSALPGSSSLFGKSIPSYGVLFQAMATHNNANVLSAPSIIALDNADAKYKVGTNIPYKRGQSVGGVGSLEGSVTTNIERQDLLLELDIKPHISIDDSVLLEIKHDSKDLQSQSSDLGPTWSSRSFETRVLVRDQQTVVIGGLMQERETVDQSKVPILGDIPLLGHLFKYTTKSKQKTNLLIMLTPYIVKDQMDLEAIRARKQREQDEFTQSFGTLDHMKYDAKIDYARKRGLVEEINRTVQGIEEDIATRHNFVRPAPVDQGLVAPTPIPDAAHL